MRCWLVVLLVIISGSDGTGVMGSVRYSGHALVFRALWVTIQNFWRESAPLPVLRVRLGAVPIQESSCRAVREAVACGVVLGADRCGRSLSDGGARRRGPG